MRTEQPKNPAAVALGRLGGSAATEAQKAAARRNGRKGGRPRKKRGTSGNVRSKAGQSGTM